MDTMQTEKLLTRLTDIDNAAFDALMELHKARHVSNNVQGFYDYRNDRCDGSDDKTPWTDAEKINILTGYNEAATDHDIIHDYIIKVIRSVQHVHIQLDALREELKPNDSGPIISDK